MTILIKIGVLTQLTFTCSKSIITPGTKTPERRQFIPLSSVSIIAFEQVNIS